MSEIRTAGLAVGYDGRSIISEIEINIHKGRITALIGPNGAGKSTLLRTISGHLTPVSGVVYMDGRDASGLRDRDRARLMSVMMTDRTDTGYMTCFDVVSMARYPYTGLSGHMSEADIRAVDEAVSAVGADDIKDREFARLSDGQKQRILLARAIAQEPEYMILDEPTSFLDIGYKLEFVSRLRELIGTRNIGVLLSMHELELVRSIADTVIGISADGRIDRIGSAAEMTSPDYVEHLFGIEKGEYRRIYGAEGKPDEKHRPVKEQPVTERRTHCIMVQGTMSGAGKSLITAGLCRIFSQDGYRVAPFKSQNMALNSYVTADGAEMGRAQVMQAEACGREPDVDMNPILLKPTGDSSSQVIVSGRVVANMGARDYFDYKVQLIPEIRSALNRLSEDNDIIVIEGAGSPAEINLKQNDIVNMGMAEIADAPVLLVGDIDRGGVFAQLLGTVDLLEPSERERVKGLIINKFRGDKTLLDPGIDMIEDMSGIPVVGVLPYMYLHLEDEDSLSERFDKHRDAPVKIGVIRLPHISNYTDFDMFEQIDDLAVEYITAPGQIRNMDMIILPGTKNTISDMNWLRTTALADAVKEYAASGRPVMGICGGYQMLGICISDPDDTEAGGSTEGLGLLPVSTLMRESKSTRQSSGRVVEATGLFKALAGVTYSGYEIHMGETTATDETCTEFTADETGMCRDNIYGTYIHGFFDERKILSAVVSALADAKGISVDTEHIRDRKSMREADFDLLADTLREYMDMDGIYAMMGIGNESE